MGEQEPAARRLIAGHLLKAEGAGFRHLNSMIVIPALELSEGKLVRPGAGPTDDDVLAVARELRRDQGALLFHLEDSDAASGPVMERFVEDMVSFQVGGAGCEPDRVPELMKAGAERVALPTAVLADPKGLKKLAEKYGVRLLVELQVEGGTVQAGDADGLELGEALKKVASAGVGSIVIRPADGVVGSAGDLQPVVEGDELEVFLRADVNTVEEFAQVRDLAKKGMRGLVLEHSLCGKMLELAAQLAQA